MRLTTILSKALIVLSLMAGAAAPALAQAQIAKPDSVQATALGALPASNCPNIQTQWYATGQVPSGYYKQGVSPFHCLPIPACASNQSFDQTTATCGCAAGTIWDGADGTCHAPCASGTAWNGSACVNTCPAGTAWNGSSCASICSAGTTWNGSSCVSVCAAGTAWNGTSCQSICGAGTAWNGSSCASICSGGQSWNGSACACPAGQTFANSTCGTPPSFTSFGIAPLSQNVGGNHVVSWATSGSSPVSAALFCSGATSASNALTPSSAGSGNLTAVAPGSTNCIAQATNDWGTTQVASPALTAACPPGTSWNGSACSVASAGFMNGKRVTIHVRTPGGCNVPCYPQAGANTYDPPAPYIDVIGQASQIRVQLNVNPNFNCVLTTPGGSCSTASFTPGRSAQAEWIARSTLTPYTQYEINTLPWVEYGYEAKLNLDGSISVWFYFSSGVFNMGSAYGGMRLSSAHMRVITAADIASIPVNGTLNLQPLANDNAVWSTFGYSVPSPFMKRY